MLSACALDGPVRKYASVEEISSSEVDKTKSSVQVFSSHSRDIYLYVQLKDKFGKFVEHKQEAFSLNSSKGKKINFSFERSRRGHYYLTIPESEHVDVNHIDIYIQNKLLKGQHKLQLSRPHSKFTRMKIVNNFQNVLSLELQLRDQNNAPVELPESPEIMLEGVGYIQNLRYTGQGVWLFEVNYPEENQIMYFGIRALEVKIPNLYRYQHVEK